MFTISKTHQFRYLPDPLSDNSDRIPDILGTSVLILAMTTLPLHSFHCEAPCYLEVHTFLTTHLPELLRWTSSLLSNLLHSLYKKSKLWWFGWLDSPLYHSALTSEYTTKDCGCLGAYKIKSTFQQDFKVFSPASGTRTLRRMTASQIIWNTSLSHLPQPWIYWIAFISEHQVLHW